MSDAYSDDNPVVVRGLAGSDILRLALLLCAAVIAAALAVSFLLQAGRQTARTAPETTQSGSAPPIQPDRLRLARQSIAREIAREAPDYAVFFARLHTLLPAEYDVILTTFAKQALAGKDVSNVDLLLSQAVRDLRLSNGILAAKADGPALSHIFAVQLQMMQALAVTDPKLCVDFLYGGASQAFFAFSSKHRHLVADMAIAGLQAIASGRRTQLDRALPNDADFNQLSQAMKTQGVSDAEAAAILDGKTPVPPISDARMCTVGQIYLKSLASLPEHVRLRIYALAVSLMARS